MNVFHEGPHEVADNVIVKLRSSKQACKLWIAKSGYYRIERANRSFRWEGAPDDSDLVGVYNTRVSHKAVRDDVEFRMKEIRA